MQALCLLPLREAYVLACRLEEAQALAGRTPALARTHQERDLLSKEATHEQSIW